MSKKRKSISIYVSQADLDLMLREVKKSIPQEACGLLAGHIEPGSYRSVKVIPITNALKSPVSYRMEPQEQLQAFNWIEEQQLALVGIYHSHPNGPPHPSAKDIAEAYYPQAASLIWSPLAGDWQCQAFLIQTGRVSLIKMLVY